MANFDFSQHAVALKRFCNIRHSVDRDELMVYDMQWGNQYQDILENVPVVDNKR